MMMAKLLQIPGCLTFPGGDGRRLVKLNLPTQEDVKFNVCLNCCTVQTIDVVFINAWLTFHAL